MRIARIAVRRLDPPLAEPYRLSGGRLVFERLDGAIARIDTDDGPHGRGESRPWGSTCLPAFGRGVRAGLEELAPAGRAPARA